MSKSSITAYHSLRRSFPSTPFTQLCSNIPSHNDSRSINQSTNQSINHSTNQSISLPIIQAPMMGSTSLSLISSVCNTGALGSLPAYKTGPADLKQSINQLRKMTNRPFAVNLGVPRDRSVAQPINQSISQSVGHSTSQCFNQSMNQSFDERKSTVQSVLVDLSSRHNIPINQSINQSINETSQILPDFYEQLPVLLDLHVPIISFVFGVPDQSVISECKNRGILTIGTATSVAEVSILCSAGIDAVIAQGAEAGGHRGGFRYRDDEINDKHLIGLLPLLSSIRQSGVAGLTPIIAAGGIADGPSTVAAFMNGAHAVQIGTAFLTCTESSSTVPEQWRDMLLAPSRLTTSDSNDPSMIDSAHRPTVVTRAFTSRPARGFANDLTERMHVNESSLLPWPQQNALVSQLVSAAAKQGDVELMQMWAGQAYHMCQQKSAADLIEELMQDAQMLMNPESA